MNAREACGMARRNALTRVRHAISAAADNGYTRTGCSIRDVYIRYAIVRELKTDGYQVTSGDHDGDIVIDWGTP